MNAAEIESGQHLTELDGVPFGAEGLLVESARLARDGDVVLTVWGATAMIELRCSSFAHVQTLPAQRSA